MRQLTRQLVALAVALACGVGIAEANPMHNPHNPYDVDANGVIQPLDFLLVVNELQRREHAEITPLTSSSSFYWDTNNDAAITPWDALLVANRLAAAPEPSTLASLAIASAMLLGYAWRRKRHAA